MPTQPPNRVRFPMDFRHRIYLCRECHNHVLNVPRHNSHLVFRSEELVVSQSAAGGQCVLQSMPHRYWGEIGLTVFSDLVLSSSVYAFG
ncbi:hypothetical protein V6N12_019434 [Hibiscus sabdariffa]|uniref:Yippee domain-containing protein n=1 Tax=Hibiscus sabdariffa TaxID=183260 RepID=A0ABR2BNT8_9ROSI